MTILDVCAGLVVVDEITNTVKLAHYTVQEYLIRNSVVPEDADLSLAMACITFLSFDVFAEGACTSNASLKTRLEDHPFLQYAAPQLPYHLADCNNDLTTDAVNKFLGSLGNITSYLQVLHHRDWNIARFGRGNGDSDQVEWDGEPLDFNNYPKGRSSFHIAAALGHLPVFRQLFGLGTDISARDSYGWTALHSAA